MPKCLDDCDFQSGWCGWVNGENGKSDDADWQREAGSSSSAATGPAADHTTQSTAGQRKENHVQFDLGYPATSYPDISLIWPSSCSVYCLFFIHFLMNQILLRTKTKWINPILTGGGGGQFDPPPCMIWNPRLPRDRRRSQHAFSFKSYASFDTKFAKIGPWVARSHDVLYSHVGTKFAQNLHFAYVCVQNTWKLLIFLKHRDSFGKKQKTELVLYLIRHYPKYFSTTFTLWTEVRLTIW